MTQKVRIVSNGMGHGTRVYDADGNKIDHTLSVAWRVTGPGIASATIEVNRVQADIWAEAEFIERVAGSPSLILAAIQAELARQIEIHPVRPRHPYHWHTVLGEEVFEALVEVSRLTQDFAAGATVDTRLDAARRLRTELIQVAAVACAWAETLPASAAVAPRRDQASTRPEVATASDRAPERRQDEKEESC